MRSASCEPWSSFTMSQAPFPRRAFLPKATKADCKRVCPLLEMLGGGRIRACLEPAVGKLTGSSRSVQYVIRHRPQPVTLPTQPRTLHPWHACDTFLWFKQCERFPFSRGERLNSGFG